MVEGGNTKPHKLLKHTLGHISCPACEQDRATMLFPISADMFFGDAAGNFLEALTSPVPHSRARYRAKNTIKDYEKKIKALRKFFGDLRLQDIHLGHFRNYQRARTLNEDNQWAHTACASKVNGELSLLKRLESMAGCWTPEMEQFYETFQVDEGEIPRALNPEEQEYFLDVSSSETKWHIVYWYSLLALHTGFSSDELRTIRQGDVNIAYQILAVNRKFGKNKYRRREIPLTEGRAVWALEQLLDRSYELVGRSPEKYIFPFRIAINCWDGTRPMTEFGIRKRFEEARDAANLRWFQLNGWRHTAITRMAEAGIPMSIIQARVGHTSPKMTAHYTHITFQAEQFAMKGMNSRQPVISIESAKLRRGLVGY
jgi:integrase